MASSSKLGLRIKIGNEEKDLDEIFLKIEDYNANSSEYQEGEAVELIQNTGIKYIDENGVKRDLIERYIGYDSEGYIAANYEADPNRIDAFNLNAITDTNGNNLVNLFYQLGTKKKNISSDYKSYIIHNRNKRVNFDMKFLQNINLQVISNNNSNNEIFLRHATTKIINILNDTVAIDINQNLVDIKNYEIESSGSDKHRLLISGALKLNVSLSSSAAYSFNKDTV